MNSPHSILGAACLALLVLVSNTARASSGETAPGNLEAALTSAIEDEYKARAIYQKVLDTFGDIRPFSNIVKAENRHIDALERLFAKHGFSIPPDEWPARVTAPTSIKNACTAAVMAERENVALYDGLLASARGYGDVEQVFTKLQAASRENHLPAFERCSTRGGGKHGRGQSPCSRKRHP